MSLRFGDGQERIRGFEKLQHRRAEECRAAHSLLYRNCFEIREYNNFFRFGNTIGREK
jgi:hypothetical protein